MAAARKAKAGAKGWTVPAEPDARWAHPVTRFALDVAEGRLVACKKERLACERHLRDLRDAHARGLFFVPEVADYYIKFFRFLHHYKGEWAGRPLHLDDWEVFIVGSVFGWLRADGTRRFRELFAFIARKNGKSTLGAGLALIGLVADREPGAEVYSAATKRDQARIVYEAALNMARRSPALSKWLDLQKAKIEFPATAGVFLPLSHDAKTMDGLNVHLAVLDELHAHKTREVYDVIKTAVGARRQPLIAIITTAGEYSQTSICREVYGYAEDVLEGRFADESADEFFAYIAEIDKGDDWQDERVWVKANPALRCGVLPIADLRAKAKRALSIPAAQTAFRQKHLNEWVQARERAIPMELWEASAQAFRLEDLAGRRVYAGLDLGKVNDLSALALLFPPDGEDEFWRLACRFWCPEDDILTRTHEHRVPYLTWQRQGWIEPTPGNATDYRFLQAAICAEAERFDLVELSYDRHFAHELIQNLQDELGDDRIVPFGQGFISMGNATAAFLRVLVSGQLRHNNNPVLNWCMANLVFATDPAGNTKPDKKHSREKIDGAVAGFNAFGRAVLNTDTRSVYEDRGLLTVEV